MIRFTIFDPLSGKAIAYSACSHKQDVWAQPLVGQGFVLDWRPADWTSAGDEGFVRNGPDDFMRTGAWLDLHWPAPQADERS
jgi:hypothetical protein